jgi:large subunit ribosomal protein L46
MTTLLPTRGRLLLRRVTSLPTSSLLQKSLLSQTQAAIVVKKSFSTSTKKKADDDDAAPAGAGYLELKQAAKDKRRVLWENKEERKDRLQTRRAGRPRQQKGKEFKKWFIKKKVDEEYMNRKAQQAGLGWDMQVAVLLERTNVVQPDMEEWEADYEHMRAYLNRFGKEYPKALFDVDDSQELATKTEDLLDSLPKDFQPAPRETQADETGEVRTTNRKLKTSIYLAVQENDRWQLPTVTLSGEDETLVEAAKRAMAEKVGPQVEFWCPSHAPWAVDMVALPEEERTNVYGTKTFFVKIQYDEGDVSDKEMSVQDFAWLDRGEMADRVNEEQGDYMSKFYQYML